MASIKIHQDLCNFQRRRGGLTARQIGFVAAGIACFGVGLWVATWCLGLPVLVAPSIAMAFAMPALVCGFVPFFGMPIERAWLRHREIERRGNALAKEYETAIIERSELTRDCVRKSKKKGYEATDACREKTR